MKLPILGVVDIGGVIALGFLAAVLLVTAIVFAWVRLQMNKPPGSR